MASLKWVKITTNIASDFKMNKLIDQPQGKRLLLAWILLLCLAGELNQGGYFISGNQPLTIKDFKIHLKETTNFLNYSFKIFINLGILGVEENTYYITNWDKHQSEEMLEKKREKERLKKQKQRAKKRETLLNVPGDVPPYVPTQNKNKKENKNYIYNNLLNNYNNFSLDETVEQDYEYDEKEHNPVYKEPSPMPNNQPTADTPTHIRREQPVCCSQPPSPMQPPNGTTGATVPANISQIITQYCQGLSPQDTPSETQTMLLTWLETLVEKQRLPTVQALLLMLEKLPQIAKESRLNCPDYLREVICRGWNNFYPIPTFTPKTQPKSTTQTRSYNLDELEAMI